MEHTPDPKPEEEEEVVVEAEVPSLKMPSDKLLMKSQKDQILIKITEEMINHKLIKGEDQFLMKNHGNIDSRMRKDQFMKIELLPLMRSLKKFQLM